MPAPRMAYFFSIIILSQAVLKSASLHILEYSAFQPPLQSILKGFHGLAQVMQQTSHVGQ